MADDDKKKVEAQAGDLTPKSAISNDPTQRGTLVDDFLYGSTIVPGQQIKTFGIVVIGGMPTLDQVLVSRIQREQEKPV